MTFLLGLIVFLLLFGCGHYFAALLIYLNHRYVFHGNLRRVKFLKPLARLHGLHHAHLGEDLDQYIFTPWWIKAPLYLVVGLIGYFVSFAFALGITSFALLYQYRHWAIHHHDFTSHFHHHHMSHHTGDVRKNCSGMYPFIDKIFGTYVESRPDRISVE